MKHYYQTIIIFSISIFFLSCGSSLNGHIEVKNEDALIQKFRYSKYEYHCGEVYMYNDSKNEKYEFTVREDKKTFNAFIPTDVENENYLTDMKESSLPRDIKRVKSIFETEVIELNPGEIKNLGYYYKIGDHKKKYYSNGLKIYNKNHEEIEDDLDILEREALEEKGELFHKLELTRYTYTIVGAKKVIE